MERLTERDEYGNADIIALSDMMPELYADLSFSETNALTDALNRLAAYEDIGLEPEEVQALAVAKEAGRLVVLPVNLGQKVWFLLKDDPYYYPDTNGWFLSEETVTAVTVKGFASSKIDGVRCSEIWATPFEQIGKTAFITREEAEAALGAQKGGESGA